MVCAAPLGPGSWASVHYQIGFRRSHFDRQAIGIEAPGHVDSVAQLKLDGVSMVYTFNNATAEDRCSHVGVHLQG